MTEDEEAHLAMYMRVIEFFRKNEHTLEGSVELKEEVLKFKGLINQIFELLTDEEWDKVLERYKYDMEYLNNMEP